MVVFLIKCSRYLHVIFVDYNIVEKLREGHYTSIRDEQTMTQYIYGGTGMVSYDDERAICDKTQYAQERDLNGYIIWEISGDLMPDLSTPLLDAANAKLLDPSIDCASMDLSTQITALISEAHPKPDDSAGGSSGPPKIIYYPDYGAAQCLNDGKESAWLQPGDIFHTPKVSILSSVVSTAQNILLT